MFLSVVSPVYYGYDSLPGLVSGILKNVPQSVEQLEIILVDDACPKNSWEQIVYLSSLYPEIVGVKLSRNFGQHYAIMAGLSIAKGEWVVVMDCDLQDKPEEIPALFHKAQEGYHLVQAVREQRKDKVLQRILSAIFYKLLHWLSGMPQNAGIANFGIYNRKVINAVLAMGDTYKFFPSQIRWTGFRSTQLKVSHGEREWGKSGYSWRKRFELAFRVIVSYSNKPLRIAIKVGFSLAAIAFIMTGFTFWQWLNGDIVVAGYASLMASIWFVAACIMLTLGVFGIYLGSIFDTVKRRPDFLIDTILKNDKRDE
jgi:glycosyltransferase involved in cell wall biosynthesis